MSPELKALYAAHRIPSAPIAEIEEQTMTDGSIAHNILLDVFGKKLRLACLSRKHAFRLEAEINACSWVEFTARWKSERS